MSSMHHDPEGRLPREKVAIVGVGGTGSHILDFISRMPVEKIHLFDGDVLCEKNTRRSPGVIDLGGITPNKAVFYAQRYESAHPCIQAFGEYIEDKNVERLAQYTTVFLSSAGGSIKRRILEVCRDNRIVLINVGMGATKNENSLLEGIVGTTICLPDSHERSYRYISRGNPDPSRIDDNHQTIELNALNAALAVIRWKKYLGIYEDGSCELDSCYWTVNNSLINRP